MAEKIKSISKSYIIIEDNSELLEIKSKKYTIDISKDKKNNYILIVIIQNEKNMLRYKRKLYFLDFLSLNYDFFIAFKKSIPLLFKYLKRLIKAHLFSVDYNNNEEILSFTLICLKETKQIVIEIFLYNESNKLMHINRGDNQSEKNDRNELNQNNNNGNDYNELTIFQAAPVAIDSNDRKEENNNVFYYNPNVKNTKTVYYLYVYKKEYIERNYKEIILRFVEKEKEKNTEYVIYLDLIDFFNLSKYYYSLFDYSIDDIFDDLLLNLSNHNYIIDKYNNRCRLWLFIFNSNKAKEIYYQMSLLAKKEDKKRNEVEINNKINFFFEDILNYIKEMGDDSEDENIQNLIHNPLQKNEKYLAQINISISKDILLEKKKKFNKNKSKNNSKFNSLGNAESKKEENSNIENNIRDNIEINNISDDMGVNSINEDIKNKLNKENIIFNNINSSNQNDCTLREKNLENSLNNENDNCKNEENKNNLIITNVNNNNDNKKWIIEKNINDKDNIINNINDNISIINNKDNIINKTEDNIINNGNDTIKNIIHQNISNNNIQANNIDICGNEYEKMIKNIDNKSDVGINYETIIIKTDNNLIKKNNLNKIEKKKKKEVQEIKKEISINDNIILNDQEEDKDKTKEKNINKNKKEKKNMSYSHKENISDLINDNSDSKTYLNQKRNQKKLIEDINIYYNNLLYYSLYITQKELLKCRKRIAINESFLSEKQIKLIINKIEKNLSEFRCLNKKIYLKLIYEINNDSLKMKNCKDIIMEFYQKSNNVTNLIFLIKTINNRIFGGFTHIGFVSDSISKEKINDNDSFVFSINKMKTYNIEKANNNCIFCNKESLPEFKNQIYFEKNILKYGYTGEKKRGYLVEEDYELNEKEKLFYVNKIQLINIKTFN